MLTIRLQRRGRRNSASFRVVVVESKRKAQTGNYLEMVGHHDPRLDKTELKAERIQHWIAEGTTVSPTVHNLLVTHNIIKGPKINVLPKKTAPAKAAPVAAAVATPAAVEEATSTTDDVVEIAEEISEAPLDKTTQ